MAPLPIAIVMSSFNPGGTERQMIELIRRLDRADWRVEIACMRPGGAWLDRASEVACPHSAASARHQAQRNSARLQVHPRVEVRRIFFDGGDHVVPFPPRKPLRDEADAVRGAVHARDFIGVGIDQPGDVTPDQFELALPVGPGNDAILLLLLGPRAQDIARTSGKWRDRGSVIAWWWPVVSPRWMMRRSSNSECHG